MYPKISVGRKMYVSDGAMRNTVTKPYYAGAGYDRCGGELVWTKSMHIPSRRHILTLATKMLSLATETIRAFDEMDSPLMRLTPVGKLWGVTYIDKATGQNHRMHIDVEHLAGDGVTIVLPLSVSSDGLHVLHYEEDGRTINYPLEKHTPIAMFGDVVHGFSNYAGTMARMLLVQVSSIDVDVRMPKSFDQPIIWGGSAPYVEVKLYEEKTGV